MLDATILYITDNKITKKNHTNANQKLKNLSVLQGILRKEIYGYLLYFIYRENILLSRLRIFTVSIFAVVSIEIMHIFKVSINFITCSGVEMEL